MFLTLLSAAPVAIWLYLLTARGGYWRMRNHLLPPAGGSTSSCKIVAVVPARNEADVVARSVRSLLLQHLATPLQVVLVDDASDDGTAETAERAARELNRTDQLTVIRSKALPKGWSGKLWAVSQGIEEADRLQPDYLLLTDADIRHAQGTIASLLSLAETRGFALSSVMVTLATATVAEKFLIPAFVYFFLQLYPPAWIRDPRAKTAGAAGGCMLIRPEALREAGGIRTIADAVIDDCSLAALVKKHDGAIWMGLTTETESLRSYGGFIGVGKMISRSAFNQLNHSGLLLAFTLAGLFTTYLLPPLLLASRRRSTALAGAAACLLMGISYAPTIRLYRRPLVSVLSLPLVALFYAGATIHSALRYWSGTGGHWKGRIQDGRRN